MSSEPDELLDLVDAADAVIGTIWRSEYDQLVQERRGYIRAIDVLLINSRKQVWIPKRTADKKIAPNGLDFSCGGHVGSGEDYVESALREIEEELNLTLTAEELALVRKFEPDDICYIRSVYMYRTDETPDFNPQDFVSAEWLTADELLAKLDSGVPAKRGIRPTILEFQKQGLL